MTRINLLNALVGKPIAYEGPQQRVNLFSPQPQQASPQAPTYQPTQNLIGASAGYLSSRGAPSVTGLDPTFGARFQAALQAGEAATGHQANVISLDRTNQLQAQLYSNYTQQPINYQGVTYTPQAKGGLAAYPGQSLHNMGLAGDLAPGPVADWMRANAGQFGLMGIGSKDPNHFQMDRSVKSTPYDIGSGVTQQLASLGYSGANAVKDYQTAQGLKPDGIVGPNTLASLTSRAPAATATATPTQVGRDLTMGGIPAIAYPAQYGGADIPQGMLHNNPANLIYNNSQWQADNLPGRIGSAGSDQGNPQIQFSNEVTGMTGGVRLAMGKYTSGMTNLDQIIAGPNGWTSGALAKPAAKNIADTMGVSQTEDLHLDKPANMTAFMKALVKQEQGGASSLYPASIYDRAVQNILGGTGDTAVASASNPALANLQSLPPQAQAAVAAANAAAEKPQVASLDHPLSTPTVATALAAPAAVNPNLLQASFTPPATDHSGLTRSLAAVATPTAPYNVTGASGLTGMPLATARAFQAPVAPSGAATASLARALAEPTQFGFNDPLTPSGMPALSPIKAGYANADQVVRASLGQDPSAINSAWKDTISKTWSGGSLGDYFKSVAPDVQLRAGENFAFNPQLWNAVPASSGGVVNAPIRAPLQTASEAGLSKIPGSDIFSGPFGKLDTALANAQQYTPSQDTQVAAAPYVPASQGSGYSQAPPSEAKSRDYTTPSTPASYIQAIAPQLAYAAAAPASAAVAVPTMASYGVSNALAAVNQNVPVDLHFSNANESPPASPSLAAPPAAVSKITQAPVYVAAAAPQRVNASGGAQQSVASALAGQSGYIGSQQQHNDINSYFTSGGYGHSPSPGPSGNYGSSYTPAGYTAPNFNPVSGGSTFAYKSDGQGGGTFVNSSGQTMNY